jgi:prophage regulatory protein
MSKLTTAKALADEWAAQAKDARRTANVCSYFDHLGPHDLIRMWESGKSAKGQPLSPFEFEALVERWAQVFNQLPPDDDYTDDAAPQEPAAPEPELPADTMLRAKEVLRLIGVSESSLKRMVLDGRFPKPMRLSPRRIGWPARDVKAWLEGLDGARSKTRT